MANPKFKIKHSISKKEWNKTHKDFKSIIDGVHYVMKLTDKGTALVPVKIIDESLDESTISKMAKKYKNKDKFISAFFAHMRKNYGDSFRDLEKDKEYRDDIGRVWDDEHDVRESVDENFAVHMAVAKAIRDTKVKNPDTNKDVKVTTALKDKSHPAHKQAKSLFQRIKDRIMGEEVTEGIEGMSKEQLDRVARGMFGKSYSRLTMDQTARLKFYLNKSKKESVNESKEEVTPQQLSKIQSDIRKINSKIKVYISKHPITKGELSIELGAGHNDDSEIQKIYKVLKKHTGDWRTGTMFNESVNEGKDPEIITQLRDVVKNGYQTLKDPKTGKRMKVDSYSASAIVGVYDVLNSSNQEKFTKHGLLGMQKIAFKFIK